MLTHKIYGINVIWRVSYITFICPIGESIGLFFFREEMMLV